MDRSSIICRDCMWMIMDAKGDCWEECKGRYRPGVKINKVPVIYNVNSYEKAIKILPLLQINDTLIIDECGKVIGYDKT